MAAPTRRLILAAAAAALLMAGCDRPGGAARPSFKGVDITGAEYARDFALTDHNGQPRSIKDFAGKVVVVFFGYTQCPDVCPTTMLELATVRKSYLETRDKALAMQRIVTTFRGVSGGRHVSSPGDEMPLVRRALANNHIPYMYLSN